MSEKVTLTEAFATSVREARLRRGWDQKALAERLSELGRPTNQATIARLETGKRGVSLDDVFAFALALGVAPVNLIAGPSVEGRRIVLTSKRVQGTEVTRDFIRGQNPFPLTERDDIRSYFTFVGGGELDLRLFHGAVAMGDDFAADVLRRAIAGEPPSGQPFEGE